MPSYVARLPVRFNEIDSAGIVYYPRFFDYFHMAFEDFFEAATGTPYHAWIRERRVGWPTVHIETTFQSPLRYGMLVQVEMSFPRLGKSSFVTLYRARDAATGTLSCESRITVVSTDLDRFVPIEIPPEVRTALSRFSGD